MSVRSHRRAATTLALAAVAGACALAIRSPDPGIAQQGPKAIEVKATFDSCTEPRPGEAANCHIAVLFDPIAGASTYEVTITAPGGRELLTAPSKSDAETFTVPYAGNGTYGVRVTGFRGEAPGSPTPDSGD